jgi:hypothetical protein
MLHFDDYFDNLFNSTIGASINLVQRKTTILLAVTYGLTFDEAFNLKWEDVLEIESDDEISFKSYLNLRKYDMPIHPKVGNYLIELFECTKLSSLKTFIVPRDEISSSELKEKYIDTLLVIYSKNCRELMTIPKEDLYRGMKKNFVACVLFGRKVLENNGFDTRVCNALKLHFKLRTNAEILSFLQYSDKTKIDFSLSNFKPVPLDLISSSLELYKEPKTYKNGKRIAILTDNKSFNNQDGNGNYYPFQKLTTFVSFLLFRSSVHNKPIINSIRTLLLFGSLTGVRLSHFLKLNWNDLVLINESKQTLTFRDKINISETDFILEQPIKEWLRDLLFFTYERVEGGLLKYHDEQLGSAKTDTLYFNEKPNLSFRLFITNTLSPLEQPSLSREITNVLTELKYKHASKFTTKSTMIMYGRRIVELNGDHRNILNLLKRHYRKRTLKELCDFLYIDYRKTKKGADYEFKNKGNKNIFESVINIY